MRRLASGDANIQPDATVSLLSFCRARVPSHSWSPRTRRLVFVSLLQLQHHVDDLFFCSHGERGPAANGDM